MSADRESIAAVGTAMGTGSRAMIRVSGSGVLAGLASGIRGPAHELLAEARRGVGIGRLSVEPDLELPIIVTTAPGPNSFTGEDVVEIQVPAPDWLAGRIRDDLVRRLHRTGNPARAAGPGEFSARAFLAGRLSTSEAMAIALSIDADRADQLDIADRVRESTTGTRWNGIRARLVSLVARLEAGIDFTDEEDVVACRAGECHATCLEVASELEATRSSLEVVSGRSDASPRVVLSGPSNAGKSTLFNALAGSTRSIVADVPGTTRDAIETSVELRRPDEMAPGEAGRPVRVVLVDVAGHGDSSDPLASEAAAAGRRAMEQAMIVLECRPVDDEAARAETSRRPRGQRGDGLDGSLEGPMVIEVRTKCDLAEAADVTESEGVLRVSARSGEGLADLRSAIGSAVVELGSGSSMSLQRDLLGRVLQGLETATTQVRAAGSLTDAGDPAAAVSMPEVVAATLRLAIDALAELDGELDPDRVLDEVFGRFCIGK